MLTADEMLAKLSASTLPQRQGGLVSYNPVGQRQAVVDHAHQVKKESTQTSADASLALLSKSNKAQGAVHKQGVIGTLLNNPIGKAVTGALSVVDLPRSYVVSGVKELSDLANKIAGGMGADVSSGDTGASWADFLKQGRDHIGFGDVVHAQSSTARDNKWVGRVAGFGGDVALDPLTYLTVGAGHFAGQAGRISAAEKLAAAGMDATKVGRLGVTAANQAEREAIFAGMKNAEKLATPGIRFMGTPIGGTEKLAEHLGSGLSKTRAAIGDTKLGTVVRGIRSPKGLEEAYKTLATGVGDTNQALELISHVRTEAMGSKRYAAHFANESDKLARDIQKQGDGVAAFTALDEGLPLTGSAAKGEAFFAKTHAKATEVIPLLGKRENYAPHIWTPEARTALRGDGFKDVRKTIGMDVTEATGGAVKRAIHPGSKLTMPDGTEVHFIADTASGAVSARQINEKLAPILGVDKVIENDLAKVLHAHVTGLGDSVGRALATAERGNLTGLGTMVDTVNKPATLAAGKKEAKAIGKAIATEGNVDSKIVRQLSKDGGTVQKAVASDLQKQLEAATAELHTAQAAEKRAGTVTGGLAVERKKATTQAVADVSAAQKKLDTIAVEQQAVHEAAVLGGHTTDAQTALNARRDAALHSMSDAQRTAQKQYDSFDAAHAAAASVKLDSREAAIAAKKNVATITQSLSKAKRINVSPSKHTAEAYNRVQRDLEAVVRVAGDSPELQQASSLLSTYAKGVADLRDGHTMNVALTAMQKAAAKGELTPVLMKVIQDGYEQIGTSLLGDAAPLVKKELADQLRHLEVAINDPGMWKIVDKYTQYFKTWATATVGFHVRNGMTAGFMNASDGVTVRNMGRGAKLWESFERNPQGFLDKLPDWVTSEQADGVMKAVFASGGGGGQFGAAELHVGKSKILNNPWTRASHKLGSRVEGYARSGMALDTILNGGTWQEASARISRIHFDYSQVSKFDEKMKRIIPFWTFLSRNVPLQVQQMFLKPRVYQQYKALTRNMGQDYQGGMIPLSWQEAGAFRITDGVYAAPDLTHIQLQADLGKLTSDPMRLLADANPLLKVPLETLIAKRKFFTDQPFKAGGVESVSGGGLDVIAPLLSALGLTDVAADGTTVTNEKLAYALRSLNPLLGQAQRLTGSDPYYSDKRGQSILNQLGIPVKTLTKGQKDAEAARRQRLAKKVDPKLAALKAYSSG